MARRSEFGLIAAFRERLPAPHADVVVGSGDDAAVVRAGGAFSVVSVDTTVDGVHARLDLGDPIASARDFGWRGLTTALSDLAACGVGAGPIEVYVAVTLPTELGDARVLAIADGMAEAAGAYGASVIGGDVTTGPVAVMSTTVVGWLDGPALTRAGARPGDLVGLTGPIGAAGAGLALTLGAVDEAVGGADAAALRSAYQRPVPHLAAGAALRAAGATAAIDLSDGLVADALHVAVASGVVLALDAGAVPLAGGVAGVASALADRNRVAPGAGAGPRGAEVDAGPGAGAVHAAPLVFAQSAGEDFVLLVTVPEARRADAESAGIAAWIGRVEALPAGQTPSVTGLPTDPSGRRGHDHRA